MSRMEGAMSRTRWCHNCKKECIDDGGPDGCVCDMCGCLTNIPLTQEVLLNRIKSLHVENKRLKALMVAEEESMAYGIIGDLASRDCEQPEDLKCGETTSFCLPCRARGWIDIRKQEKEQP